MPRLSVDIDLTYLPVQGRAQSLAAIDAAMRRIEQGMKKSIRGSRTTLGLLRPEGIATKLPVRAEGVQIDRSDAGSARLRLPGRTSAQFLQPLKRLSGFAETRVVSFADIYGGKIVAAFDRQQRAGAPRSLVVAGAVEDIICLSQRSKFASDGSQS